MLNLVFLFLCALLLSEEKENQNDYGWEKSLQKGKFEHQKLFYIGIKALLAGIVNVPNFGKFNLFFFLLREPLFIFLLMYLRFLDYRPSGNVLVYHLPLGPGIGAWNENIDIVVHLHLSTALISIQKQLSGLLDRKKNYAVIVSYSIFLKIERFFSSFIARIETSRKWKGGNKNMVSFTTTELVNNLN